MDFRRSHPTLPNNHHTQQHCVCYENLQVSGIIISQDLDLDLTWTPSSKRPSSLRQLRKFNLPQELSIQFHTVIQSVLCTSITLWFGSATKQNRNQLTMDSQDCRKSHWCQPALHMLHMSRVRKQAGNIIVDLSHPGHNLFQLLPSGRRYRALYTNTTRHTNSFFPQAITLMNTSISHIVSISLQHQNIHLPTNYKFYIYGLKYTLFLTYISSITVKYKSCTHTHTPTHIYIYCI